MASLKNTGINWNQQGIIFQYVPIFFKLAHSLHCILCAFLACTDIVIIFDFANKNYFRNITGVGSGEGAVPLPQDNVI